MVNWRADELTRYESRRSPKIATGRSDAVEREAELHRDILAECKRRGWLVLHGSMASATGRTVGEPDFVILTDRCVCCGDSGDCGQYCDFKEIGESHRRVLLIEAKTRTGKLSAEQAALHAWAAKLGHTVHTVRSYAEFLEVAK